MKDLPYMIITKKLGIEADKWCNDNIGERWFSIGRKTGVWACFWAGRDDPKNYKWYFRNEKDAFFFGLRWS